MIIVYPMLTSASVNPQLLPGIIKAIEKYILVHQTDEVLKYSNNVLNDIIKTTAQGVGVAVAAAGVAQVAKALRRPKIKKVGKKLKLGEQQNLPGPTVKSTVSTSLQKYSDSVDKGIDKGKTPSTPSTISKFEMPRHDAVSLEPTWVQIQTAWGAKVLGIKVVPFKVQSTNGMVGLMMNDSELKKMGLMAEKAGRVVKRVLFRVLRGMKVPGFKDKAITGDAKTDVVLARSQYGKNMFICFSKLDIEQDDMFSSPAAVQKLHKLGWASMVVADDVNKQATFCMKQFGGVCTTLPYSFLFSAYGKEVHQVYKDIEDAARSAGPFFRRRSTTRRKLFKDK